jgi:hypothetical protein
MEDRVEYLQGRIIISEQTDSFLMALSCTFKYKVTYTALTQDISITSHSSSGDIYKHSSTTIDGHSLRLKHTLVQDGLEASTN